MKLILFELYYRSAYIFVAICFIECFTYFIEGPQLEYFSGLFTFNYQALDFNFHEDVKRQVFLKQNEMLLTIKHPYSAEMSNVFDSFLALSTNEAKTWFHLFTVYLSYFYCVELNKTILYHLLIYIKVTHIAIFMVMHIYGMVFPGLLKKSGLIFIFVGIYTIVIATLFNEHSVLMLVSGLKELQLEQLDSELI